MANLDRIYEPWGGNAAAMARDIDEKEVTVRQWRNRGRIDQSYWPKIIRAAALLGSALKPDDFMIDDGHADLDSADADGSRGGKSGIISAPASAAI